LKRSKYFQNSSFASYLNYIMLVNVSDFVDRVEFLQEGLDEIIPRCD